jgi:hypothetical protein
MRTLLYILSALVTVGFGFWAYHVNYDTQAAVRRVEALQQAIAREREQMTMLRAEWAWLSRPERLRALVEANREALGLVPLGPAHFGEASSVIFPERSEPELPAGWDGIGRGDIVVTEVSPAWAGPRPPPRPAETGQ